MRMPFLLLPPRNSMTDVMEEERYIHSLHTNNWDKKYNGSNCKREDTDRKWKGTKRNIKSTEQKNGQID